MTQRESSEQKKLPRHYWPIMVVWMLLWGVVIVAAASAWGVNPYIALSVGWGLMVLWETYQTARWRSRG